MADPIDIDPTRDDEGAAKGGATGGGDDDAQDWSLPGGPTDSPEEQRRRWYPTGEDQRQRVHIQKFQGTMEALICQPFLQKEMDYPPLQRTLKKLLSLREHLQDEL